MRIVAGELRGRALVAPKGHSTRPTADRVRQALFDVLEHAPWSPGLVGLRVIDLFAGSGALGLEALSRGAAFCLFVDNARAAVEAVEENARLLMLADRVRAARLDATGLAARTEPDGGYQLAFLDPPYGAGLAERALRSLRDGGWLSDQAVLAVERGADEAPLDAPDFETLDVRVWGPARVRFLMFRPPS